MTLPDRASIGTYGGALNDYEPVRDASTDRPASGANPAYADVAAMTRTSSRAWARFVPAGTGAPALASTNAWDAHWNWPGSPNAAPVVARASQGKYTVTFPATVYDEIPTTQPGGTVSGHATNFRAPHANAELGSTTPYLVFASVQSANVLLVTIYSVGSSPGLVDPNDGTTIGVFGA